MSDTDRYGRVGGGSAVAARDDVNLTGLDDLFRSAQIDALVCRSGMNVAHLAGITTPGTLGRHLDFADTPRETFVVWPASGEPVVIANEIASQLNRATSRVARLEVYTDYAESPQQKLAEIVSDLSLVKTRVGFDKAWFGANRWSALTGRLQGLEAVDCTDEFDRIRAIKTPTEVLRLRAAADLLD